MNDFIFRNQVEPPWINNAKTICLYGYVERKNLKDNKPQDKRKHFPFDKNKKTIKYLKSLW